MHQFDFFDGTSTYHATAELEGITEEWTAKVHIPEHPTTKDMNISYHLGDYLSPIFLNQSDFEYFSPLIDLVKEAAYSPLSKEEPADIE